MLFDDYPFDVRCHHCGKRHYDRNPFAIIFAIKALCDGCGKPIFNRPIGDEEARTFGQQLARGVCVEKT